ncbi:UPF0158 family protein [Pelotomaculum propionicicum]|uniref:Uncharacterized protein n=1 Tax=Pelotomaculum propionicicum TaxID=258475 RepID=A0A4Y7RTB4_9FIRM|nr:UPF0158 family protein [Pelotomaculum propionicicum]NLI12524.1 hypothetical protein [Peptococcaceae bacterium]TEB12225.1 hypothetical protein Pmgp_01116 [Pelotomaculum propionicicum]
MRQVAVTLAWIINAFENSSKHSEYYVDLQTGDVRYFSPMDFPEHEDTMKKLDKQPERFVRLPKLEKELSLKIKQDFIAGLDDANLKKQLENELEDIRFRRVLMDYEEERRKWYRFQNERYTEFLKKWFGEKNIELVEKSM